MNFLKRETELAERLTPGLLAELEAIPFAKKESRGNPTMEMFRQAKGPSLIIPKELGGFGASPVDAIRFQRAMGAAAPSMALATNMHHFTVALLGDFAGSSAGIRYLLKGTAENSWYLASGFAEGATAQSTLTPNMIAQPGAAGYVVSGRKKPCSLSKSMDILTASVGVPSETGGERFGVAIIPANTAGVTVRPFWTSPILAGAESDEVILEDVLVTEQNMFLPGEELDPAAMQASSFVWFQLLTSSCYLGVGSALMTQLIKSQKGSAEGRVEVAAELEGAMAMLEGVAHSFQSDALDDALITRALFARYAVAQTLVRTASRAAEMLGGIAFISNQQVSYLMAAVRCLAFHPPSKASVSDSLDGYLSGQPFHFV